MSDTDKKTFTIERMLKASPEKVWMMWTTREGLERWWGPEGFNVEVLHIDVRVGGHFELIMKTEVPEIIAMLKEGGMGASSRLRGDYTVVDGRSCRGNDARSVGRGRRGDRPGVDSQGLRSTPAGTVGWSARRNRPSIGAWSRLTGFGLIDSTLANHHGPAGGWLLGRGLRCLR